jgi:nucleoside-diphosphate-sugar epimerase
VVTGAAGNLGTKAVAALRAADVGELVEIDRDTRGLPGVIGADLSTYDESWADHFRGVDVVVHLAADHRADAEWATVLPANIDGSLNVLRAAEAGAVGRVVFASSNWVLGGHRFGRGTLTPATPPLPVGPYGASKLFIERAGLELAARTGIVFVALRIGYCQPGDNVPGPAMGFGRWGQEMWLSNDDWAQAVVLACARRPLQSGALNVMSRNTGMRWDLDETRRRLGYEPTSQHRPVMTPRLRIQEALARGRDRWAPRHEGRPIFGERW